MNQLFFKLISTIAVVVVIVLVVGLDIDHDTNQLVPSIITIMLTTILILTNSMVF